MSPAKILVVDDDPSTRLFVARALQSEAWEVLAVSNGLAGLEVIPSFCPSLVITDLSMPEMDGLHFISELRKTGFTGAIVIVTAADLLAPSRSLSLPPDCSSLMKPVGVAQLKALVQGLLTGGLPPPS